MLIKRMKRESEGIKKKWSSSGRDIRRIGEGSGESTEIPKSTRPLMRGRR
jgi:hypothetical protein